MSEPTEQDLAHLRKAIRLSESALARGERPFGAVLVSASGQVLAETETRADADRDGTSHAETNALRAAWQRASPAEIAKSTMYASGEPCPMCAGAMVQLGIRRVVFGISWQVNRPYLNAALGLAPRPSVSCRDVFRL